MTTETIPQEEISQADVLMGSTSKAANAIEALMNDDAELVEPTGEEQKTEDQPQVESVETEVEDTTETDVEDEPELDSEPEPELYTVKVDGEEVRITLDELKSGYQKDRDYRQKTAALADQRRELETELQGIQQERQRYSEAITFFENQVDGELEQYQQLDWAKMEQEDPVLYLQMRERHRSALDNKRAAQEERQRLQQQEQSEAVERLTNLRTKEMERLVAAKPEWKDPVKAKPAMEAIKQYGISQGYSEQEMRSILDHRSILILEKAKKFDEYMKANPIKMKVANVPKVTKPGVSKEPGSEKAARSAEARKQHRKEGSVRSAANFIEGLL